MIVDHLFDNKKNIQEGLADEFMAMAKAKGMNPRLAGTPDEERARTDAMLKQRAADRANAPAPASVSISDEERAGLEAKLKKLEAEFDPGFEYSDDHRFWKEQHGINQQINAIKQKLKRGMAEGKQNKKRRIAEAWLMEDPVYRKFKRVGRYIAERKLTEPEILKIFADAETGMTDKATGANRTFLGRGKDTTMDFAGGVADALKGVWSGLQSSTPISFVDVTYDKATDALADLTGGEKGAIMQAIKKYRMLAKEYPKTAGLAKGALVAITGLATGGAGLPAIAAFVYGLDSAVKGDKFSDIALKAGGAAATAWAASKIAGAIGGDQAAAPDGSAGGIEAADQVYQGADTSQMLSTPLEQGVTVRCPLGSCNGNVWQAEPGQTLTDIAQQIGVDPAELAKLNPGLTSPGGAYTVVKGDELGFIAQAQGTTPEAIRAANPDIDFSKALQKGQQLNLPTANTNTGSLWKDYQGGMYGDKAAMPELLGGPAAGDTTNLIQRPSVNIKPGDYSAAPEISPTDVRSFGSGAPDTSLLSTSGSTSGTLSGVTGQQIASSPVYQQIYAQEIAKYGAEPSARAIQTAQQIATLKAKQAMAGVVRESTDWINKVKLRRLSVDKLIDQKLTTLSWALNESIGKPQGRSMHLTPLGVYTVFENIQRIAELDKVPTDELSPEEIARNERIRKMYQATQGRGLERAADGRLVGFVPDPDDPEGEGPNAQLYYDDDFNLIGTSKPIPGLEISKPTPGPTPAPTPAPKPGPAPTPTPTPSPAPAPARPTGEKLQQAADQLKTNVGKIPAEQIQNSMRALKDKGFGKGDPIYDTYAAEIQKRGIENVKKRVPTLKPEELQKGIDSFAQQKRGAGDPIYDIYAAELEKRTGKPGPTPTPTPTPSPTPTPAPKPGPTPTPTPAPTTPTGDAAGPGREALPDLLRPDMADAPTQPADPAKKSWFGRGLDALDRGTKAVGSALSTAGRQLTRNVTKEKLKMNWQQAGKPTDSDQLSAYLVKQGVPIGVVNGVYEKMGLPVSAIPATADQPADAEKAGVPRAPVSGGGQTQDYAFNPKTGKPYTVDELLAYGKEPEQAAATDTTSGPSASTTSTPSATGTFNAANVMKLPGMEKYAKKTAAPAKTANFAGPSGYGKTTTTVKPMTGIPGMKTAAPAPTTASLPAGGGAGVKAAAPAGPKVTAGGPTPEEQAKLAQRIAQAAKQPVAEMLQMVETKEDVARIKQFIDQTFIRYGAVSESAFAVRNQLIEHVSQVGAQRRREHSQRLAK